jgi:hypothetical protein
MGLKELLLLKGRLGMTGWFAWEKVEMNGLLGTIDD